MKQNVTQKAKLFSICLVLMVVILPSYAQHKTFEGSEPKEPLKPLGESLKKELVNVEKALIVKPNDIENHNRILDLQEKIADIEVLKSLDISFEEKLKMFNAGALHQTGRNNIQKPTFTKTKTEPASKILGIDNDQELLLFESYFTYNYENGEYLEESRKDYEYLALGEYYIKHYRRNGEGELEYYFKEHIKENPDSEHYPLYYKAERLFNGEWIVTGFKNGLVQLQTELGFVYWVYMEYSYKSIFSFEGQEYIDSESESVRDEEGRPKESSWTRYNSEGEIQYISESSYSYENDMLVERHSYTFHNLLWSGGKTTYEYNEEGLLSIETFYIADDSKNLSLDKKTEYSYTSEGLIAENTTFKYENDLWLEYEKVENTYLANQLSMTIKYVFEESTQSFVKISRTTYEYDGDFRTATTEISHDDGENWSYSSRTFSGEKQEGNLTMFVGLWFETYDSAESDWVGWSYKSVYYKDELDRTVKSEGKFGDKSWRYEYVYENEYYKDTDDYLQRIYTSVSTNSWSPEPYVSGDKSLYEYGNNDELLSLEYLSLDRQASSYPDNMVYYLSRKEEMSYTNKLNISQEITTWYDSEGTETRRDKETYNYATYGELCDFTVSGDTIIVEGKVTLTAASSSDKVSYVWKDSEGETISEEVAVEITTPGVYTVASSASGVCEPTSIRVYDQCEIDISGPENNVLLGSSGTLTAIFDENETTYTWTDGEENVIGTEKTLSIDSPGVYHLEAVSQECYGTASVEIKNFVTGTSDLDIAAINIFPNPVNSNLNIQNLSGQTSISIHTIEGRQVYRGNAQGEASVSIDLSQEKPGLYILELRSEKSVQKIKVLKAN